MQRALVDSVLPLASLRFSQESSGRRASLTAGFNAGQPVSTSSKDAYAARILRVVTYIQTHLDGDLCVERLSEVAGFLGLSFVSVRRRITLLAQPCLKKRSRSISWKNSRRVRGPS